MRTQALLSMMVLATAPAALAETAAPAESCVLKTPLKATRPGGVSQWETLAPGTELAMVSRKSDWSRVRHGDTVHIVATSQFNRACVAAAEAPKTETSTKTAAAEPAKTETKAEPAKTDATAATTTAATEPAKTEPAKTDAKAATTTTATEPAKADAKAETKTEPAKAETTTTAAATEAPGSDAKTGPIAASATTRAEPKAETTDAKKAKTSPLPSSPSSGQLFVLGLLLLGAVFTGVFLRRRAVVEHNHLDVVATRTLGRGKQLIVVDAGDARLLLGVTEQGITLLSSTPSSSSSESSTPRSSRTKLSLLTEEEEAANASTTAPGLFGGFGKGLGKKVGGLWGRPPAGPPADWDSFDRILASTVPDSSAGEPAPSNSRRSSERSSSTTGSADLAELARELQKHGVRRSA